MATPPARTFSTVLRGFRKARMIKGTDLAKLAGIAPRSLSRWERNRDLRPRDAEVRKLIAAIATLDYPTALDLSEILALSPPPDPRPKPPEPEIAAPVAPVVVEPPPAPIVEPPPPPPPPVPSELVIDPVEAAMFRAAEALGITPTPLRPVLARFLGHVAALGITAAEAQLRLG